MKHNFLQGHLLNVSLSIFPFKKLWLPGNILQKISVILDSAVFVIIIVVNIEFSCNFHELYLYLSIVFYVVHQYRTHFPLMTPSGFNIGTILKMYISLRVRARGLSLIKKSSVPTFTADICWTARQLILYKCSSMSTAKQRKSTSCKCNVSK